MAKVDKDRFLQLLQQSQLVDAEKLPTVLANLEAAFDGNLPDDAEALAQKLVQMDVITSWQSGLLLGGKYKGFMLGKYKLLQLLGSGGMSSVYLALHTLINKKVAIKVLPKSKVEDSSYLARFRNEARAAALVQHPNIVQTHDIDSAGNTHYIVMDYVAGTNLQSLVKENGWLDYESAADFMAQAAEGLHFAHENGLVHRDIKPANLLVDANKMVRVLDLGLALFSDEDASLTREHDENVLGTADYLAPEQAFDSHRVDRRADIYSLGCTLYFLLTGHPPFPEGTLPQRLMKHQTQTPPSIYEDRPDAPAGLVNICMRMMAKTPDARYQTAAEVAQELSSFMVTAHRGTGFPGGGSGGTPSLPDPPKKELKTRGSNPNRGTPRPKPPGAGQTFSNTGNTISNQDSETFKSPGKPAVRKGGSSVNKRVSNADLAGKPGKRPAPPGAGLTALAPSDSSEFVFETEVFGTPASIVGMSSKKSVRDQRAERKRSSKPPIPWWIWASVGVGLLLVCFLTYKVFAGG
jgi:eukaryotic-like serine/threonine-protein kinase